MCHKITLASDTLIDFQITFSISIGETVTHGFTLIALSTLRRFDNENTLSLMNLILRSILTDLQVTPTKPGRMTKPYSSHHFIANYFNAGNFKKGGRPKAMMDSTLAHHGSPNRRTPNVVEPELRTIVVPMAENHTMEELLQEPTEGEALQIIENKSKVRYSRNKPNVHRMNTTSRENASKTHDRIDKLADQISTLVDIFANNQPSVCVATGTYNQVSPQNRARNFMAPPGFVLNQSLTLGTLPSNTILNSKGEMKAITTRSGVAYEGPSIPINPSPKKNGYMPRLGRSRREHKSYASFYLEKAFPNRTYTHSDDFRISGSILTRLKGVTEDIFVKVGKFHFPTDFVVVDFEADPRVPLIFGRSFLRIGRALIDVNGEEITIRVNDEAVTFNLNQTTRYSSTYDDFSVNRIDIIDVAREEYA
nr:reverse transcriptase domain-containing protein [Tanacetum cinerariifolium]